MFHTNFEASLVAEFHQGDSNSSQMIIYNRSVCTYAALRTASSNAPGTPPLNLILDCKASELELCKKTIQPVTSHFSRSQQV